MFYSLLISTFLVALLSSHLVIKLFSDSIQGILKLIVPDEITQAWLKYIKFAIYVVGISGGVRIWEVEKYITSQMKGRETLILTSERWVLEIYRTLIDSLKSISSLLLVFFIFTLIAYIIIRVFEKRNGSEKID